MPVKKPTTCMGTCERTVRRMNKTCNEDHTHLSTYSGDMAMGVAKHAQVYPYKRCKAIIRGLAAQFRVDGRMGEAGRNPPRRGDGIRPGYIKARSSERIPRRTTR